MLRLIQIEFLKLRRRKFVWLMLLAALFMPFFALLYFKYVKETGGDPLQFYKWSAFGFTLWFILPVVLGTLCTMLMYEENQHDMLKQLWIVPISKMGYFFSKFFVVLLYSICFMLITAVASVMFSVLPGYVAFDWGSVLNLLKKCLEIGVITSFVMLPILAIAASQKGYILPVSITLVYVFLGFILMTVNMYLHPLTSMAVIVMRNGDIPGLVFTQAINIPLALLCICVWVIVAVLLAIIALGRRK
ncbi:ABC transporter permease [Paenibacillus donghaensis]|uniref:ABC transporter permease n=1 Tax=Paenibacillus donghaensis TaxID=414771 RepID=A0A2Z2KC41_9BACL|nr:ABC transporter permease [Paenibacillus donghaensis]ASA20550.1 ABC transporter permease [Paenibacillus donghaensis]